MSLIFTVAFVVMFIHASTWEGMINEWVRNATFNWPEWIKKPLYDCPIRSAPWHGSLILLGYGLFTGMWLHWYQWIITVFAAGGINTVLIYLISANKEVTKELKDED